MSHIDAIDERVVAELQANGRLTMKALAERVGLSSPAMIERVRRLEDRGVIAGYRAIVAPEALGRPITAWITASVALEQAEAFLEIVRLEASVLECHRVTGDASHVVKAHVADSAALEALIDALGTGGTQLSTQIVLSSPIPWKEITSPEAASASRTRGARRRRPTVSSDDGRGGATGGRRGPGRPRGRVAEPESET